MKAQRSTTTKIRDKSDLEFPSEDGFELLSPTQVLSRKGQRLEEKKELKEVKDGKSLYRMSGGLTFAEDLLGLSRLNGSIKSRNAGVT